MVGTFSTYNAVGKQVMSNKQTLPSVRIGTSSRDASKKVRREMTCRLVMLSRR